MNIKIITIGKLEENRSTLSTILNDKDINIAGEFSNGASALSRIESVDPDIVLITMDPNVTDVFSISERIYLNRPKSVVILLTKSMDVNILQRAMKAGIRHVVPWTEDRKKLIETIKSVYNKENSHRIALSEGQRLKHLSQIITVFGTKGGSGKTTIAVNLAVKIAKQRKKVALVDLDLQYGDVSIFMNLDTNDTLYELIQGYTNFDIDTVKNHMMFHSSGVNVLSAPKSPEYAEYITKEHIEKLINVIRPYYDYIIIDVASNLNESTLTALDCSTLILLVVGLDVSILKNSKISLKILESLQQKHKVMMVINRESKGSITVNDAKKLLQCPLATTIPSDWKIVGSALNMGIPFVLNASKSKVANSITELTNIVIGNRSLAKQTRRSK